MTDQQTTVQGKNTFEALKKINEYGAEHWSARELQPMLGYSQWRRFEQAIERAITSCKESGNPPEHHFAGVGKPITGGKGAVQIVDDYQLSPATPKLTLDEREAGGLLGDAINNGKPE